MQSITIALIADDPIVRQNIRAALSSGSYAILEYDSSMLEQGDALRSAYAVCLSIRNAGSLDRLQSLRALDSDLPVIGVGDSEFASRALDAGAYDFVADPLNAAGLLRLIGHAAEKRGLSKKVKELRGQLDGRESGGEDSDEVVPLRELERQAIGRALRATKGSVTKAAKLLGIGRATLYRRLASPEMANLRPRLGFDAQQPVASSTNPPATPASEPR
jgi:DNA-binding NtrC family response regulator